jgi:hypothetical protein
VESGYLGVEVNGQRPGLVRIVVSEYLPTRSDSTTGDGPRLRYAARFNDTDAALMHTHELLKRRLVDLDAHLYRSSEQLAIAAIESLGLSHRDVYFDPGLDQETRVAIESARLEFVRRRKSKDQIFATMGYLGIGILLFKLLAFSF